MKKDFSKLIIAKIKKDKIKPTKKWKINLINNIYWLILSVIVLLSGAFLSFIILDATFFGPEVFGFFKFRDFFRILIRTAPYLWIFSFAICIVSGILIFQKTKTGYRYNLLFVASIILLIVSILGVTAHFSRMNEQFENEFFKKGPNPVMMQLNKERRLFIPEEGVLVGEIVELNESEIFIKDPMQENWTVDYSRETKIDQNVQLVKHEKIVVFGEKNADNHFFAVGIKRLRRPEKGAPRNKEEMLKQRNDTNRFPLKEEYN